jgi:[histone H3]-lysine36 N-dimethyltransferase SETMAR
MIHYDNSGRARHWRRRGRLEGDKLMCPKPSIHQKKLMLMVFWSVDGIVHYEFMPRGKTINAEFYCRMLDRVVVAIEKRGLLDNKQIVFLQDNARPHTAKITKAKLVQLGWTVLPHPPYSPDLAPTDFFLFKNMARDLNRRGGRQFKNDDEVKDYVKNFFEEKMVQKDGDGYSSYFREGIERLPVRWQRCVDAGGDYFHNKQKQK